MKVFRKNYPVNRLLFLVIIIYFASHGQGCAVIQNIIQKETQPVPPRPESAPPLRQAIATLSVNARVNIQAPAGDITLSAQLRYTGMDSLFIQVRDPLKRQLAQFTLTDRRYTLWLQRENRHLSGAELPETIGNYTLPQIPLDDLAELLIGQIDRNQSGYYPVYDRHRRLIRLSPKSDNQTVFIYDNWNPIGIYYWIPHRVNLNFGKEVKITIQYSQFQVEFRKLT